MCLCQASAKQRAGRVGRLMPGIVFRLYTPAVFAQMQSYGAPAMQRCSLASTVLTLMTAATDSKMICKPRSFTAAVRRGTRAHGNGCVTCVASF